MKKVLIIISALLFNLSAVAAPFGLEPGMKERNFSDYEIEKIKDTTYKIVPRNPNSLFEVYYGTILPKAGLCRVWAITPDVYVYSDTGDELKSKFNEIESLLIEKYGKWTDRYDYLNAGSTLDKPNNWLEGIKEEERTLKTFWFAADGAALPHNFKSITLIVYSFITNSGYVRIQYEYTNVDSCTKEEKAKQKSSL